MPVPRARWNDMSGGTHIRVSLVDIPDNPDLVSVVRVWEERDGRIVRQDQDIPRDELEDGEAPPPYFIDSTAVNMARYWPWYSFRWLHWERGSSRAAVFFKFTEVPILVVGDMLNIAHPQSNIKAEQRHMLVEIKINEKMRKTPHDNILTYLGCDVEHGRVAAIVFPHLYCTLEEEVEGSPRPDRALKWTSVTPDTAHVRFSRMGRMGRPPSPPSDSTDSRSEVETPSDILSNVMTDITAAVAHLYVTHKLCYMNLAPHNIMYNPLNGKWVIVGLGECHSPDTSFPRGLPGPVGWRLDGTMVTYAVVQAMLRNIQTYIATRSPPQNTH
ncbi:hypothetical protein Q8F55_007303 [Vanrija albida]|uniref:Protein kinase domain-containing protein n=1 Tax=Vanrija albida TaxID=181172 RepID=A0ABR3PZX8_9TREE